jgi:hypothetical protein
MSTSQKDKSGGKPRQRGRKGEQRRETSVPAQSPKLEQRDDDQTDLMVGSTDAMVASTDAPTNGAAAPVTNGAAGPLVGEVLPPIGATASADRGPVTIRAIATAYGDYTTRSFEEGMSFVGKLMGVRSFDKAIEVQTEFARQAYANFFAQSQRICELYGELARQAFRPWERLTQAGRQIS